MPDSYLILAVVAAYIVKGMCGFANTLVFTSILSFREANVNISPVELIVGYPSNFLIAWRERKTLSVKIWLPLSLLVVVGSIPGVFILKNTNIATLKIVFGVVVILLSIEMFLREKSRKKKSSHPLILGVIGLVSGILCGLFGIGALLAAYIGRTTEDASTFRGNLCAVFMVENTFRIMLYLLTGIITLHTFQSASVLFPFMLIGLFGGTYLGKKLNDRAIKKVIIILLMLSGVSLVITNIL